jgi:hypothetical protein
MDELLRFPKAMRRDPRIEAWFSDFADPHRLMARTWFERMRGCGADVRELLHDGCPVACVADAPFGYVNAFKAHANVGFFHGAALADPAGLLEGNGKRMRHVKLRPGKDLDVGALGDLIETAYQDIRRRLGLVSVEKKTAGGAAMRQVAKSAKQGKSGTAKAATPSQLIDARIEELADWRGETLARVRKIIKEADPDVVETWKWRGVPVWEHSGIICTGETYKAVVKLTFAKGASLDDPSGLFNSSLEGNVRRAIDIREGDKIDQKGLKALVRAAIGLNTSKQAAARPVRSQNKRKGGA